MVKGSSKGFKQYKLIDSTAITQCYINYT